MTEENLKKCQDELDELKEENRQLRQSAGSFGALAERLRDQLEVERRKTAYDRRTADRDTPDRRRTETTS